jgi:hypothetical protein
MLAEHGVGIPGRPAQASELTAVSVIISSPSVDSPERRHLGNTPND